MKLSDTGAGLLVLTLGGAVVLYARTFPPMPGQNVGPSFFPTCVGLGLVLVGLVLAAGGLRPPRRAWLEIDDWVRSRRLTANFALVVADLVFYALAVDALGFFLTGFSFLAVLFVAFGQRLGRAGLLAAAATFVVHYGFYTVLRVPLPWGILRGLAW